MPLQLGKGRNAQFRGGRAAVQEVITPEEPFSHPDKAPQREFVSLSLQRLAEGQVVGFNPAHQCLQQLPGQCQLTFERCRWRLGGGESTDLREGSFASVVVRLDAEMVRGGFAEPLHLVGVTRTIIDCHKPGGHRTHRELPSSHQRSVSDVQHPDLS